MWSKNKSEMAKSIHATHIHTLAKSRNMFHSFLRDKQKRLSEKRDMEKLERKVQIVC